MKVLFCRISWSLHCSPYLKRCLWNWSCLENGIYHISLFQVHSLPVSAVGASSLPLYLYVRISVFCGSIFARFGEGLVTAITKLHFQLYFSQVFGCLLNFIFLFISIFPFFVGRIWCPSHCILEVLHFEGCTDF